MKKINGFTLVELLAVIIILCITVTIVVVKVDKNIKDANDFGNEMLIENIESASLIYAEEYSNSLTNLKSKNVDTITISTLINSGLLISKDVKDTHASVLRRMGRVGGNGTFSKSADYDTIHGEELSASGILDKVRDTFKDYKIDKDDDEKVLSDDEDDYDEDEKPQRNRDDYEGFDYYDDENEEYFYEIKRLY